VHACVPTRTVLQLYTAAVKRLPYPLILEMLNLEACPPYTMTVLVAFALQTAWDSSIMSVKYCSAWQKDRQTRQTVDRIIAEGPTHTWFTRVLLTSAASEWFSAWNKRTTEIVVSDRPSTGTMRRGGNEVQCLECEVVETSACDGQVCSHGDMELVRAAFWVGLTCMQMVI